MIEPLTAEQVAELPEGTPVAVTWSGGNGPHDYVVAVNKYGSRYAWVPDRDPDGRLRFYNPLEYVGPHPLTQVWLREPNRQESIACDGSGVLPPAGDGRPSR